MLYQRYLGDEMLKQDERGIKPLENMIARIGWSVKVVDHEDIIQIRLVIFPPQVAANSDIVEDNKYTFSPKQSKEIFDNLEQLAEYYLSYLNSERFSEHLSVMGFDNVVNELIKGEKPLAKYHSEKIAESATETRKHLILSVKGDDIRSQIEHRITRNPDITSSVAGKSNADPYRCTLIGLTDIVPFFTLDAIEEAKLDYASDPLAHVFHAEQQATMLEREWYTRRGDRYLFHPRFVRLLENESLIRELALAFLYGLLEIETIGIKKQAYLRYELSGKSREIKILQSEQIDIFDIFNQSFNSWLQSPPENPFNRKKWPSIQSELSIAIRNEQNKYKDVYSYLETIEEEILDRLDIDNISQHTARQAQRRPWKKDVDVYLWLLIEEEKNYILEDWE